MDESIVQRVARMLVAAYASISPDIDGPEAHRDGSYRSPDGVRYRIGPKSNGILEACARIASTHTHAYPMGKLADSLRKSILSAKDQNITMQEIHARFQGDVRALIQEHSSLDEWEVIMAVARLNVRQESITLGRCHFQQFDRAVYEAKRASFVEGKHASVAQCWDGLYNGPGGLEQLIDGPVAIASVSAADQDHAQSLAIKEVQDSLNVWCYGLIAIGGFTWDFPQVRLDSDFRQQLGLCIRKDSFRLSAMQRVGCDGTLPPSHLQRAKGWPQIVGILCTARDNRVDLARRAMIAIQWCANAAYASADSVRIVSVATALEALFIQQGECIG